MQEDNNLFLPRLLWVIVSVTARERKPHHSLSISAEDSSPVLAFAIEIERKLVCTLACLAENCILPLIAQRSLSTSHGIKVNAWYLFRLTDIFVRFHSHFLYIWAVRFFKLFRFALFILKLVHCSWYWAPWVTHRTWPLVSFSDLLPEGIHWAERVKKATTTLRQWVFISLQIPSFPKCGNLYCLWWLILYFNLVGPQCPYGQTY